MKLFFSRRAGTGMLGLFLLFGLPACFESNAKIHPRFSVSKNELEGLVSSLPDEIQNNILERPQVFFDLLDQVLAAPPEVLALADKNHSLLDSYIPEDLVRLDEYSISVSKEGLLLREIVMPDLLAMNESAKSDGIVLQFSSAFRSFEYQKDLYERNVRQLGKEQADRESARPGKSQHQLGTTVDFGSITDAFAHTPAGIWLAEHAWRFGFSLSYPEGLEWLTGYKYESWHFRYLTRAGTALEKEFFNSIQHYFLTFLADNRTELLASRIAQ